MYISLFKKKKYSNILKLSHQNMKNKLFATEPYVHVVLYHVYIEVHVLQRMYEICKCITLLRMWNVPYIYLFTI